MHYSGILIVVAKGQMAACLDRIEALSGIDVHYVYPESSRVIAVQETDSCEAQQDGLRRLQALPGVILAELSYYQVEPADAEFSLSATVPADRGARR